MPDAPRKRRPTTRTKPVLRPRATKPDISQADRDACTDALLASGEAAPLDEHGKLPAGATHKAVRQRDGSVKVVRRRFSIA